MDLRVRRMVTAVTVLTLLSTLAVTAWAGDNKSQSTFGSSFFFASPPCPVNQFPTLETIAPVPAIIDPFEQDFIPMFCQIEVERGENPVKRVKGTYETELIVRDNSSGEIESFPVKSGRFKTNSQGRAGFDFELPAELFADGFESGDVSAWSYTRTDFANRKRGNNAAVSCGASSSRSN